MSAASGETTVTSSATTQTRNDVHHSQPPSVFIFNVDKRTRIRQINDGPWEGETLLQCFTNALRTAEAKGYIVQGAMYAPEGVNIFIDTGDEAWSDHIDIHEH